MSGIGLIAMRARASLLSFMLGLFGLFLGTQVHSETALPGRRFILNEHMIDDLQKLGVQQPCDPRSVLPELMKQIGPKANVYPTENYYYFQFFLAGKAYSGSLNFNVGTRDNGIIGFACYETYTSWLERDPAKDFYAELSAKDGIQSERTGDLEYTVTVGEFVTKFQLNKIDQTPNQSIMAKSERFAGRSVDEAGLTFDLIYNQDRKVFYFVLDSRRTVSETFLEIDSKVRLGRRTGFIFYQADNPKRLILIAAHTEEMYKNTWLDGPFDQLPENFYESNSFWKYVYEAYPKLKGQLTPSGKFKGSDTIFALVPYRGYSSQAGIKFINNCRSRFRNESDIILCVTQNPAE